MFVVLFGSSPDRVIIEMDSYFQAQKLIESRIEQLELLVDQVAPKSCSEGDASTSSLGLSINFLFGQTF